MKYSLALGILLLAGVGRCEDCHIFQSSTISYVNPNVIFNRKKRKLRQYPDEKLVISTNPIEADISKIYFGEKPISKCSKEELIEALKIAIWVVQQK